MGLNLITLLGFVAGLYILGCSSYQYEFPRFGNKYYYVTTSFYTNWFGAWGECSKKNMNLLSIESREENEFLNHSLREIIPSYYYESQSAQFWTAGSKFYQLNRFYWTGNVKLFTYTNWNISQPSQESYYDFVQVGISRFTDGLQWSTSLQSNGPVGFICERTVDFP